MDEKKDFTCTKTGQYHIGRSDQYAEGQGCYVQVPQHAKKWANRNSAETDVKSCTWDEKQQEPVQAAGGLLRKQICRKGHGRPHEHKLNLNQCALQQ